MRGGGSIAATVDARIGIPSISGYRLVRLRRISIKIEDSFVDLWAGKPESK
jgi:hypothetical protein